MRFEVRPMRLEDIPQVSAIDRECFPTMWPSAPFKRELLDNRIASYLVAWDKEAQSTPVWPEKKASWPRRLWQGAQQLVTGNGAAVSSSQRIGGFAGLWLMADEAHLNTMAVRQDYRRQGVGEILLLAALELALKKNANFMTLEVRASNYPAQALYKKYGFARVGLRRGYYSDNHEDAVIMSTERLTSALFQRQFEEQKQRFREKRGFLPCLD